MLMRRSVLDPSVFLAILLVALSVVACRHHPGDSHSREERVSAKPHDGMNSRLYAAAEASVSNFQVPASTIEETYQLWKKQDVLVLDTRTEEEFQYSHLPGAVHWDYKKEKLSSELRDEIQSGRLTLVYCSIGYRSGEACQVILENYPEANVRNVRGGIFGWAENELPMVGSGKAHPHNKHWGSLLRKEFRGENTK